MKQGFSLLELSIAIVIIGLVVGGILVGINMIRAAEIRSIMNDMNKYQSAVLVFKDKFLSLPGDMINATAYWGRADGGADLTQNCASPLTDAGTGTQTCNGNGDRWVDGSVEQRRAWQHLGNAGMVEGAYSGVGPAKPGINAPLTKLDTVTFRFIRALGTTTLFGKQGQTMRIGRPSSFDGNDHAFLTPEEAASLDSKIDDGLADGGMFRATCGSDSAYWSPPNCTGCTTLYWALPSGSYDFTDTRPSCAVAFFTHWGR